MSVIFIDASVAVSYFDPLDSNHKRASELSRNLEKNEIVTSNMVFAEIVTILSQNAGQDVAIEAGKYIKENFRVIRLVEEVENLAWEIFRAQTSKNVSYVDCTSFALYKKKAFDKAFSFDQDFKTNKIPLVGS